MNLILCKNSYIDIYLPCRAYKSEYRKKFRPFSQYQYVDGKFHKTKHDEVDSSSNAWYKEVLELRKQAGQYRVRNAHISYIFRFKNIINIKFL